MAGAVDKWLELLSRIGRSRQERTPLATLASDMGRSVYAIQRGFTAVAGESPKQYNRRLQLERAAALLLREDRTILDVALEVGFQSHEGFTRAFADYFHRSPTAFRTFARARLKDADRQAVWLGQLGPCIGVFRVSRNAKGENVIMKYDITIQDIEQATFLYREARCVHADIGATLGECLPAVFKYATQAGIQIVGPPTTVYTQWGPGMVTLRAGLPVTDGASGDGDIMSMVLPAGRGAVTVHVGAYEGLAHAHAAVETFIDEQGAIPTGELREIYLTDPAEVPNAEAWQTQIVWPLRSF